MIPPKEDYVCEVFTSILNFWPTSTYELPGLSESASVSNSARSDTCDSNRNLSAGEEPPEGFQFVDVFDKAWGGCFGLLRPSQQQKSTNMEIKKEWKGEIPLFLSTGSTGSPAVQVGVSNWQTMAIVNCQKMVRGRANKEWVGCQVCLSKERWFGTVTQRWVLCPVLSTKEQI